MKQTLSQADLQRIERMLSDRSAVLQASSSWIKELVQDSWRKCDKNNTETEEHFRKLNRRRNALRTNKAERKKIDSMIHSIRKMIRSA